jgi:2-polyprenyl-6-methoxyphenol hydroxylase-like FAD-dependent oxidoreductase
MKQPQHQHSAHAVVIGGSVAGLLAARLLADHFARVTVIERDRLLAQPDFRAGAPHARHPHVLLVRGQQIMEQLFPGLTDELRARGALPLNMGRGLALVIGINAVRPFDTDLAALAFSRPLLEHAIRERLCAMPQVTLRSGFEATGLLAEETGRRVTGVRVHERGAGAGPEEELTADLVIDASGRDSRLPTWLHALGYPAPEETTIDAQTGYSTRLYRIPSGATPWQALCCLPQAPVQRRGCLMMPVEGDRWMVTLTGMDGDYPPTDEAAYMAFAATIPVPGLAAILAQSEPLTKPYGYRNNANRVRHYERLQRQPEGLLAVGDSVYALNPVYGQGMTVAAIGALTLDGWLRERRRDGTLRPTPTFQRRLARVNARPWQLATGQDLRWPSAAGPRPDPITRLMQRYVDLVLQTMIENGEVAARFSRVQNMLSSPAALFHPRVLCQVLSRGSTTKVAPAPSATQPLG